MVEVLWLLLPVAAASGWYAAKRSKQKVNSTEADRKLPSEYIQGLNYLLEEQPDKALEVFIRIDDVDSSTIETHILLGNLFRRKGEVDRAIRIHQNLISRPNLDEYQKSNALLELGRDYLKAGLLDRAESLFLEAITIGIQKKEAYQHLKELYEQERDWDKAISNARNAQHDTGDHQGAAIAHYYCELAELAISKEQIDSAAEHGNRALTYDQNCVRASILLGNLAFSRADFKEAIKNFSNVHQQNPKFFGLVLPMIRDAYEKINDSVGYQQLLLRIIPDEHGVSAVLSLLESYLKDGDKEAAQALLEAELRKPSVPLSILREYVHLERSRSSDKENKILTRVTSALDLLLKDRVSHRCTRCGFETRGLFWQCPGCHGWGTILPVDERLTINRPKTHYSI